MAGFSIILLGFIFIIIASVVGIFIVFILPLIINFIIISKELEWRMKKIFKMWGGMLGVQFLTSLIMIAVALLIDLFIPFETWTNTAYGSLGILISCVFRIIPIALLMLLSLLLYRKISMEKPTTKTYIALGVQSVLMSFSASAPIFIVFALIQY